jgi:Fe-S-cluster containining protein
MTSTPQTKHIPNAKWSCKNCGDCCKGFSFGPVEPEIVENLKEKQIESLWEPAKDGWYTTNPHTQEIYFTHVDGHCVFLNDKNLCTIHGLWGSTAKPWFCREYPFFVVEDEQGYNITVREDCTGTHKTIHSGETIESQIQDVLSIVRPIPYQKFCPQHVVVFPNLAISPSNWLQLEPMFLEKCQENVYASTQNIKNTIYQLTGREKIQTTVAVDDLLKAVCIQLYKDITEASIPANMNIHKEYILSILSRYSSVSVSTAIDASTTEFFLQVLRNRILGKDFARMGSLPIALGWILCESALFTAPLSTSGAEFAKWRRVVLIPVFWEQIRKNAELLEYIFLAV